MHSDTQPVFWYGNSAKTKVVREIIQAATDRPVTVFDYGCGDASGWRVILQTYSNIRLIGYDPNPRVIRLAQQNLRGLDAEFFSGDSIATLSFQADFIVSFSVLEHVYDRHQYLYHSKRLLAPNGLFYLNYDDGHFRINVDVTDRHSWFVALKTYLHNVLAPHLAIIGLRAKYQARVDRKQLDELLGKIGFRIVREFYGNLSCFKGLYKHIPDERRSQFMELWLSVEDRLNEEFRRETDVVWCGDTVNLWRFMASRTLVLTHSDHWVASGLQRRVTSEC